MYNRSTAAEEPHEVPQGNEPSDDSLDADPPPLEEVHFSLRNFHHMPHRYTGFGSDVREKPPRVHEAECSHFCRARQIGFCGSPNLNFAYIFCYDLDGE
jgi:hypothetical protein